MKKISILLTILLLQIGYCPSLLFSDTKEGMQGALKITGVVYDATNEPLAGVNITEVGTSNGAATDMDGKFSMTVASPKAQLTFSYIGFVTQTIPVAGKTQLTILMKEDVQMIDEVVVVGYGTQNKVNMTGAVSAVKIDEKIAGRTLTNVSSALAGLMPGLAVQQNTGMAGASGANLLVRGLGSIDMSNERISTVSTPLIVVDGMPDVDINRIDMNDIESISVLKDASSAAIYGSRAANGVILITTKTGKGSEKSKIAYTGTFAISNPTSFYETMENYPRALTLHQRASRAGRGAPQFYDGTIEQWMAMGLIDPVRYPNENQLDWVTRTGKIQTHNVSATGSGEKHNYFLSIGLLDEQGFMINNDNTRYNFRYNLDYDIRPNIKVGTRLDGQWTDMTYAYANGFIDYGNDQLNLVYAITGITPYNYETKQFGGVMAYGEANNAVNMYADYSSRHNERERQELNGNIYGEWEIIKGLKARVDYGIRYYNQFQKSYNEAGLQLYNFQTGNVVQTFIPASDPITNSTNQGYKSLFQVRLNYDKEITKNQKLSAMIAGTEEYWSDRNFAASRSDRYHPELTEIEAALRLTQGTGGGSEAEGLRSFLGRINYSISDKYLLEANLRADGSSKFLPGHQWGYFPSASAGWRFSEESFFEPLKNIITYGKLRLSYGSLGNNKKVGRYEQRNTLKNTPYAINGNNLVKGFSVYKMINEDLSWEKTTVKNLGFDLGFLNNKLLAEIDVYNRLTTDLIMPGQLSVLLSGYDVPRVNAGSLENRGIELNLKWQSKIDQVNYGANFNFAYNAEQLKSWYQYLNASKIFLDMPFYYAYCKVYTGIAQTWEDIYNAPYMNNNNTAPGDLLYEDLNGDGQITSADKKAFPKVNEQRPSGNYGFTGYAEWKGIDFSFLLQGATGRKDYLLEAMSSTNVEIQRIAFQNMHWYDTWNLDNRYAEYPRLVSLNTPGNRDESTYWLQDMSYLRLKNIQIGYNLPKKWLNSISFNKVRVYFTAENLFTLTKWGGVDPEKSTYKDDPFPLLKTMSLGLNIEL